MGEMGGMSALKADMVSRSESADRMSALRADMPPTMPVQRGTGRPAPHTARPSTTLMGPGVGTMRSRR
jgi:hypothetical protein